MGRRGCAPRPLCPGLCTHPVAGAPGPALGTGNAAAITVDNHPTWDFISTLSTRKLSLRGPSVLVGQAWQTAGTGGGQDCPSSICHEAPAPASGLPCTIAPSAHTSHCSGAELSLLGDYLLAPRFLPGGQLCRTNEGRSTRSAELQGEVDPTPSWEVSPYTLPQTGGSLPVTQPGWGAPRCRFWFARSCLLPLPTHAHTPACLCYVHQGVPGSAQV